MFFMLGSTTADQSMGPEILEAIGGLQEGRPTTRNINTSLRDYTGLKASKSQTDFAVFQNWLENDVDNHYLCFNIKHKPKVVA